MKKVFLPIVILGLCITDSYSQIRRVQNAPRSSASSLLLDQDLFIGRQPPLQMKDYSSIFVDIPKIREIKVHDLVKIIVNQKSDAQVSSSANSRRNSSFQAQIKEFVRIHKGKLVNAAENEPTIDVSQNKQVQAQGRLNDKESLSFRITAMVVDILPNGNIILEARKQTELSDDMWGFSVTGMVRAVDIAADNSVQSEDMYNLNIRKVQGGKIFNTTRRPWGTRLFEFVWPFG